MASPVDHSRKPSGRTIGTGVKKATNRLSQRSALRSWRRRKRRWTARRPRPMVLHASHRRESSSVRAARASADRRPHDRRPAPQRKPHGVHSVGPPLRRALHPVGGCRPTWATPTGLSSASAMTNARQSRARGFSLAWRTSRPISAWSPAVAGRIRSATTSSWQALLQFRPEVPTGVMAAAEPNDHAWRCQSRIFEETGDRAQAHVWSGRDGLELVASHGPRRRVALLPDVKGVSTPCFSVGGALIRALRR